MENDIVLYPEKHEIHFREGQCRALCCKHWDINLALVEYQEGLYKSEAFCSLDKSECFNSAKACSQRAFRLKKKKDGSCLYLDEDDRCTIYHTRPIVCRNFSCDNGFKIEPVTCVSREHDDEAEICSFEGGFDLKTKFIFNPYLKLKAVMRSKNSTRLVFKDITSCKDKTVKLRGLFCFSKKKEAALFLSWFNGKNNLAAIIKKTAKRTAKQDFLNLVTYLIDENVLVGIF